MSYFHECPNTAGLPFLKVIGNDISNFPATTSDSDFGRKPARALDKVRLGYIIRMEKTGATGRLLLATKTRSVRSQGEP